MAMCILWPNLPAQLVPIVTEAVGRGFETVFRETFDDVTDEEWARADAVVGGYPPQYIDKLRNWMNPEVARRRPDYWFAQCLLLRVKQTGFARRATFSF